MKLLITGGAGFIGSNYVRMVLSGRIKGIKGVTVLDKLTYAGNLANLENIPHESLEFVKGDICDVEIVDYLVAESYEITSEAILYGAMFNSIESLEIILSIMAKNNFKTSNINIFFS